MPRYTETTSRSKLIVLEPRITRAFWSQRRAWQGAELYLHVETRYVPDGALCSFAIWEDGAPAGADGEPIVALPGAHPIENGRCRVAHRLDLDPDTLGAPLELRGPRWRLHFVASIESPAISGRSASLYVDLHRLLVSV